MQEVIDKPGPVSNTWPEFAGGMAVTPTVLALTPSPISKAVPDAASPLATLASWRAAALATPQQTGIVSQGRLSEGLAGSSTGSPALPRFTSPQLNSLLAGLSAVLLPSTPLSASPTAGSQAADAALNSGKGNSTVAQASTAAALEHTAVANQSGNRKLSPVVTNGSPSTPRETAKSPAVHCLSSPELNCLVEGLSTMLLPLTPATASPTSAKGLPAAAAVDTATSAQDNTGNMAISPAIEGQGLMPAVAGSQTAMQSSKDHSRTGDENTIESPTSLVLGQKRVAEVDPQLQVQAHHCPCLNKANCCMPFPQSHAAVAGKPAEDQLLCTVLHLCSIQPGSSLSETHRCCLRRFSAPLSPCHFCSMLHACVSFWVPKLFCWWRCTLYVCTCHPKKCNRADKGS